MRNKIRETKQNIVILFLNVLVVLMCIVMVLFGSVAISSMYDAFSVMNTEQSMYYQLDAGDFYRLVEGYHWNVQEGHEGSAEMKEYYGIAKYYEAASLYKAFLESGDMNRAQKQLKKMEQARVEMGEWAIVESQIKIQLGLE